MKLAHAGYPLHMPAVESHSTIWEQVGYTPAVSCAPSSKGRCLDACDPDRRRRCLKSLTGEKLNAIYKLGAAEARYRKDGIWYHPLNEFPGVLFDAKGFVLFPTSRDYQSCEQIRRGPHPKHIHVYEGIARIPRYKTYDPPFRRLLVVSMLICR